MPDLIPPSVTLEGPVTIRHATRADYAALAELLTAVWPEEPQTAQGLEHEDKYREERCKHAKFVIEEDGRVLAYGGYDQYAGMYHPDKYYAWVNVHPAHQRRGLGRRLADFVEGELVRMGALSVLTHTREDVTRGMQFAELRGYQEKMRYFESRLSVPDFDFGPWEHVLPEVQASGFRVASLSEFPDDAEHRQKLFDLFRDIRRDVPRPEPATDVSFENFQKWTWESPYFLPEAYFIAEDLATGAWAGSSALWRTDGSHIGTGLTGVRREYRRKRLALAMKLRGIQYARSVGAPEIRTGNESNNRPMLAINEALGFVKQPAWIDLSRTLRTET